MCVVMKKSPTTPRRTQPVTRNLTFLRGSVVVEFVAVLFMLGVVAVVAIPDSEGKKASDADLSCVVQSLSDVRSAINRYWTDHDAEFPTLEQMSALSAAPESAAWGRSPVMGDYLERMPDNPFTGGNRVGPMDAKPGDLVESNAYDWVYDPVTGVFKANDTIEHRQL